jgi:nitrate reductase NapE component
MAEAFPDDLENAEWFYPPEQRWQDKLFLVINVCLWVALAFYFVKD